MEHCQHGISKLFFSEAGYAVNHHNYIRFLCIAIIPLIRQHHSNGHYWLWMDHCANNTLTFLRQQSICFILKDANSHCVTLLRPVKDFWSGSKRLTTTKDGRPLQSRHWRGESKRRPGKFPFQRSLTFSTWLKSNWQFVLKMAIGQSIVRHWTMLY